MGPTQAGSNPDGFGPVGGFINPGGAEASFTVPDVASPGTIHIILEVTDNGAPSLYSYRWVVVRAGPR